MYCWVEPGLEKGGTIFMYCWVEPGLEKGWNYIHVLLGGAKYHTCKTKLRAVSCLEASCIIFYSESINLASQTHFRKRGN